MGDFELTIFLDMCGSSPFGTILIVRILLISIYIQVTKNLLFEKIQPDLFFFSVVFHPGYLAASSYTGFGFSTGIPL